MSEVIVGIGILMIGIVGLVAVAPQATTQVGAARLETTALFLAQQRLEQVKNAAWTVAPLVAADCLGLSNGDAAPVTPSWVNCPGLAPPGLVTYPDEAYNTIVVRDTANTVVATYPQYRRNVRIVACNVAPGCGIPLDPSLATMRQIQVTVFFNTLGGGVAAGAETSVRLTMLVVQRQ